jgi:hypothetical protein
VPGSPVTFRREKKSCATGPRTPCVTCAGQPGSEATCDPRKRRNEGRPVTVTRRLARTFRHLRRPPLAPGYIGPVHASLAPNCRQHPRGRRATRPRASCGISRVALHCLPLMLSLSPSPPLGPERIVRECSLWRPSLSAWRGNKTRPNRNPFPMDANLFSCFVRLSYMICFWTGFSVKIQELPVLPASLAGRGNGPWCGAQTD